MLDYTDTKAFPTPWCNGFAAALGDLSIASDWTQETGEEFMTVISRSFASRDFIRGAAVAVTHAARPSKGSSVPERNAPRERLATRAAAACDDEIVDWSATAIINAPIGKIDIAKWFCAPTERHGHLVADLLAGLTRAPDGKRMSINVELIGGNLMVQYYVEAHASNDHFVLESHSDLFTPKGPTAVHILWELSVKSLDAEISELTNHVRSRASQAFISVLEREGITIDTFRSQRLPIFDDMLDAAIGERRWAGMVETLGH
ncbi:hypothetical protein ACWGS9_14495 [Bradyrhizobium sp. Arg314]